MQFLNQPCLLLIHSRSSSNGNASRPYFCLSFFFGLGYGFGCFGLFRDPIPIKFAFIMASMSKMSARIVFVFVAVPHADSSGITSAASAESNPKCITNELSALYDKRAGTSSSVNPARVIRSYSRAPPCCTITPTRPMIPPWVSAWLRSR